MYSKHKSITLSNGSVSFLSNNLSTVELPETKSIGYATVHKSSVRISHFSTTESQPISLKTLTPAEQQPASNMGTNVMQVAWCPLSTGRLILTVAFTKGIQMYENNGTVLLFSFQMPLFYEKQGETMFARGICSIDSHICIGTSMGDIYTFQIPDKGKEICERETLKEHNYPVCDVTASKTFLGSCDENGKIVVWDNHFQKLKVIQSNKDKGSCCSISIWNDLIIGGYETGHIQIFSITSGKIKIQISAHARWIHSIDVASETGLLLTSSEDSFVRVWNLPRSGSSQIQLMYQDSVTDVQLVGAKFSDNQGQMFALTGYDLVDIIQYKQK